jgi:short-subunit dehydrogenase
VRGLAESLRPELSGTGVGLTAVYPGAVRTGILRAARFAPGGDRAYFVAWLDRRGFDPDRLATRVVRAVRRGRRDLVVGLDGHAAVFAGRWFPALAAWAAARAFRRSRRL